MSKFDRIHQGAKLAMLLTPDQRKMLQEASNSNLRPEHYLRIQIMLLADEGQSQTQICKTLGCSQSTARHWIAAARTGQAQEWDKQPVGRPRTTNEAYLERLNELVAHGPRNYGYPFSRWTGMWLSKHLAKEFGIDVSDRYVNRLLKKMKSTTQV